MSEITRRSVLEECLEIQRERLRICSKTYDMLEPKKGMEEQYFEQVMKCRCLQDLVQACETEGVRKAIWEWQKENGGLAGWQKQLMEAGGPPKRLGI